MTTDHQASRDAEDDLIERLSAHLDRNAGRSANTTGPGEFEGLIDELRADTTWAGPPADLRARVMASAHLESAASTEPAPEPEPAAEPTRQRLGRSWPPGGWRARWRRLAWAIPAAAVGAAVFTVGVLAVDRALRPDPPAAELHTATGTQLAPQATARMSVTETAAGFRIMIEFDRLPAAASGSYYAAWLRGPRGTLPLGTFHQRGTGTPIALWSGVDPADYSAFMITLQVEGDPPTPSELVVMTASMAD